MASTAVAVKHFVIAVHDLTTMLHNSRSRRSDDAVSFDELGDARNGARDNLQLMHDVRDGIDVEDDRVARERRRDSHSSSRRCGCLRRHFAGWCVAGLLWGTA